MGNDKFKRFGTMRMSADEKRKRSNATRYGANRKAWALLGGMEVVLYQMVSEEFRDVLPGELEEEYNNSVTNEQDDISLDFNSTRTAKRFRIQLSSLTHEELMTLSEMFNSAVSLAEPIVKLRDELAERAYDEFDNDSIPRIYRSVPRVVVRAGSGLEHDQGLLERLAGAGAMVQVGSTRRDSVSGVGEVDHGDEDGSVSKDDDQENR